MNLPVIHDALTEGGNLKNAVHKNLKVQANTALETLGFVATPNGDLAVAVADASGKTVFVKVAPVVTLNDPFIAKEKPARKTKEVVEVAVPTIFGA